MAANNKKYIFGEFELEPDSRRLTAYSELVHLRKKPFGILLYLIENRERMVSRSELLEKFWDGHDVYEETLTKSIGAIRKVLNDNSDEPRFIHTQWAEGYRFIFPVDEKLAAGFEIETTRAVKIVVEEGDDFEDVVKKPALLPAKSSNELAWSVSALLAIALVAVGVWFYAKSRSASNAPIESIAVLPFENGSGDANLDYLSEGLSESLIDRFSQLPQLKVIARNSSFKYKGANIDLQKAANELGVQAIVTGKIIKRGEVLTVRVEMIDVGENRQLWGEQYNRNIADLLLIQDDIARQASGNMRLRLSGAQQQQLAKQQTSVPEAYELLLEGRFYQRKQGPQNWKKAVDFYQKAISLDANYARAYAELATAYYSLIISSSVDQQEFLPKAKEAAAKAVELDENLAEAHMAVAQFKQYEWEWDAAERDFRKSIELNPNLVRARLANARLLSIIGKHEEAIAEAKSARGFDPINPSTFNSLGFIYLLARQPEQALDTLKKSLELAPENFVTQRYIGYTYTNLKRYPDAIAAFEEAMKSGGNNTGVQVYLGVAYGRSGEKEKAREILQNLVTSKEYVSHFELAELYMALDEPEQAFAALERAYLERDPQMQNLKVADSFDSIRDDARFKDLLSRVGLPQ